jgi:hypothetical protein
MWLGQGGDTPLRATEFNTAGKMVFRLGWDG